MAEVVIVYVSSEGPVLHGLDEVRGGDFLKSYDPDFHDGGGLAIWTADLEDALHFPDLKDAVECWYAVSKVKPLREDGKPNAPLTGVTVEITALSALRKREAKT